MEVLKPDRAIAGFARHKPVGLVDRTLSRAARGSVRRALGSDRREWAYAAALVVSIRVLRAISQPRSRVVFRARLEPGDRIEIAGFRRG